MNAAESKADDIERLRRLDVCAVSDALDRLRLPVSVSGIAARTIVRRIAGRVVTVKLVAGSASGGSRAHLGTRANETASHGDIIVVEQATGIDAAGWGGLLSTAAQLRGIGGVIIEGPARDLDEARDLGFPVYARASTARTARGRVHEESTGEPILVGGVRVATGDCVIADTSGIAFVSQANLATVLDAAERIAERERAMTEAVRAGTPVGAVMDASYEGMLKQR
jgi:regulator of RNase E activity RraA